MRRSVVRGRCPLPPHSNNAVLAFPSVPSNLGGGSFAAFPQHSGVFQLQLPASLCDSLAFNAFVYVLYSLHTPFALHLYNLFLSAAFHL